ncbi:hypothetical protein MRX96_024823 [Rhipicephalus microplus]
MQRMYENPSQEQQGVSYQPRGKGSPKGLDEIPPGLEKRLGQNARETLTSIFTGIINGDPIPEDWRRGKVCLVPKRGGNSDQLHDYRPLTVTSVLYRLFTQVI